MSSRLERIYQKGLSALETFYKEEEKVRKVLIDDQKNVEEFSELVEQENG